MLTVIVLSVIMPNVIVLRFIMLGVILVVKIVVISLGVFVSNVVAPFVRIELEERVQQRCFRQIIIIDRL